MSYPAIVDIIKATDLAWLATNNDQQTSKFIAKCMSIFRVKMTKDSGKNIYKEAVLS